MSFFKIVLSANKL